MLRDFQGTNDNRAKRRHLAGKTQAADGLVRGRASRRQVHEHERLPVPGQTVLPVVANEHHTAQHSIAQHTRDTAPLMTRTARAAGMFLGVIRSRATAWLGVSQYSARHGNGASLSEGRGDTQHACILRPA